VDLTAVFLLDFEGGIVVSGSTLLGVEDSVFCGLVKFLSEETGELLLNFMM